jgi:endonuclease IV
MKVGFNSGCLRHCGMNLVDTIKFVRELGSGAFELCFRGSDTLLDFELTGELIDLLSSFGHLSIHAPFAPEENLDYKNDEFTRKIISKLRELCDILPVEGIVFHPTDVGDFGFFDSLDLPILMENMDARKDSFKNLDNIRKLRDDYNFGFVLDIEHAFENDSSMKLTKNLIEVMGDRLEEVHLSGAKRSGIAASESNNHCLVCDSEYRNGLFKFLGELKDIPIVLEGTTKEGKEDRLKDELNCVIGAIK